MTVLVLPGTPSVRYDTPPVRCGTPPVRYGTPPVRYGTPLVRYRTDRYGSNEPATIHLPQYDTSGRVFGMT